MSQPNNMTRLEVVDIETLEVRKAIYLAGHNAQEIQAMSDSLLRHLNTFQFFVRATPSAAPVAAVAAKEVDLSDEHIYSIYRKEFGGWPTVARAAPPSMPPFFYKFVRAVIAADRAARYLAVAPPAAQGD